jgi:hypothetical protein
LLPFTLPGDVDQTGRFEPSRTASSSQPRPPNASDPQTGLRVPFLGRVSYAVRHLHARFTTTVSGRSAMKDARLRRRLVAARVTAFVCDHASVAPFSCLALTCSSLCIVLANIAIELMTGRPLFSWRTGK